MRCRTMERLVGSQRSSKRSVGLQNGHVLSPKLSVDLSEEYSSALESPSGGPVLTLSLWAVREQAPTRRQLTARTNGMLEPYVHTFSV